MSKDWNRGINGARFPNCCKDCKPPKRNPHCHSYCAEYLTAKAKFDIEADAERAARKAAQESKDAAFLMKRGELMKKFLMILAWAAVLYMLVR